MAAACVMMGSCTKANDGAGVAQFLGTWEGSSTCSGVSQSITIKKGTNNYSVYVTELLGSDTCSRSIDIAGSLSGNTDVNNFTMPQQTFTDKCDNNYTISGSATRVVDTLTITFVTTSANGTTVCNFRAVK